MVKFYSEGALRILATPTFLSMISVTTQAAHVTDRNRKSLTAATQAEMPAEQGFLAGRLVEKLRRYVDFRVAEFVTMRALL
jgi:hypothetical protein